KIATSEDPVERLRTILTQPITRNYNDRDERVLRWRGRERQRLLESFPDAVEAVYEPYRAIIEAAIIAVCEAGQGSSDDAALDAALMLHFVQTMAHTVHGGGMESSPDDVAEHLWRMCWGGI